MENPDLQELLSYNIDGARYGRSSVQRFYDMEIERLLTRDLTAEEEAQIAAIEATVRSWKVEPDEP